MGGANNGNIKINRSTKINKQDRRIVNTNKKLGNAILFSDSMQFYFHLFSTIFTGNYSISFSSRVGERKGKPHRAYY